MKIFSYSVKYVLIPMASVIGVLYSFDMYVIQRAKSVVEPTEIKVQSMAKNVEEVTIRTRNIEKILMEKNK